MNTFPEAVVAIDADLDMRLSRILLGDGVGTFQSLIPALVFRGLRLSFRPWINRLSLMRALDSSEVASMKMAALFGEFWVLEGRLRETQSMAHLSMFLSARCWDATIVPGNRRIDALQTVSKSIEKERKLRLAAFVTAHFALAYQLYYYFRSCAPVGSRYDEIRALGKGVLRNGYQGEMSDVRMGALVSWEETVSPRAAHKAFSLQSQNRCAFVLWLVLEPGANCFKGLDDTRALYNEITEFADVLPEVLDKVRAAVAQKAEAWIYSKKQVPRLMNSPPTATLDYDVYDAADVTATGDKLPLERPPVQVYVPPTPPPGCHLPADFDMTLTPQQTADLLILPATPLDRYMTGLQRISHDPFNQTVMATLLRNATKDEAYYKDTYKGLGLAIHVLRCGIGLRARALAGNTDDFPGRIGKYVDEFVASGRLRREGAKRLLKLAGEKLMARDAPVTRWNRAVLAYFNCDADTAHSAILYGCGVK